MVRVFVAAHPLEAELFCGYLRGAGIEAEARGANLFFLRGGLPLAEDTLPSVWVEDELAADARRLLAHAEARARLRAIEGGSEHTRILLAREVR